MNNRKGFTLIELLIAITIIGIILSFSSTIIKHLSTKNEKQQYKIYANSLLQASKAYNDEYSIDTFANREYGCTKIGYSTLLNKNLLSTTKVKGVDCGYIVSGKDSSGVVIRKVKDKYYYEVVLYCKKTNATNKTKDYVSGKKYKYFYELDDGYCNTEATTDVESPKVSYKNNKYRLGHFYNKDNRPQPQIQLSDNGVGLDNISDINYAWSSKSPKIEVLRFTNEEGTGLTNWKNIPLSEAFTNPLTNRAEHLKVSIKNLQDLANNGHEEDNVDEKLTKLNDIVKIDNVEEEYIGTYYIDNTVPEIQITNKVPWTNHDFNVTLNVEDKLVNSIRSGIKEVTYKLTNKYAGGNQFETILNSTAPPESGINGNYEAAKGGSTSNKFKKPVTINSNGDYSLYVKVEDWAGNVVEQEYPNYYQLDKTPPSCTLSYVSGANVAGHGLTVSLKCNDNYNLAQCGTTISGGENQTSASLTLTGQTSSITRYVKDIAGNNSSCSISISASTCKTSCCGTRKCHCDSEGKNCSRCNKTCTSGKCCGYHVG